MSKKKIAIFGVKYFPAKGGTSRVVENLLLDLKDDFEFTIYCYKHDKAAANIPNVKTIQFPEIKIKGFGVFLYYLRCCLHLLFNGSYDLVHVHKTDGAFFIPFLSKKYKVIATSHALPYKNDKWSSLGKAYFRFVEKIFMNSKGIVTAIAQPQKEYYEKNYNRSVKFIPNGIHLAQQIDPTLVDDILQKHEFEDGFLLFAARRVIPLKGCHHLIKALQKINFKGTLVVAGDVDQMPDYTAQLQKEAAGLKVKFIGYVNGMDKLNALISRAKYFVFPSEIEGMSMMFLEVGALGTPMICSDIPENKAVLSDKEVLYFESQNVDDLAEKLDWALANPLKMKALAKTSEARIKNEYQASVVAKQYTDLYHEQI